MGLKGFNRIEKPGKSVIADLKPWINRISEFIKKASELTLILR